MVRWADFFVGGNASSGGSSGLPSTLNNGLVAYWNFDETTGNRVDATGGGLDLQDESTSGNSVKHTAGKIGNAVVIDAGLTNLWSVNRDDPKWQYYNADFTICGWVYHDGTGFSAFPYWIVKQDLTQGSENVNLDFALIFETETQFTIRGYSDTNTLILLRLSGVPSMAGTKFYVVTHNKAAKTFEVFFDNVSVGTQTYTDNEFRNTSNIPTQIGGLGNQYIRGWVDEMGLWDRVLTATEISDLYNSGNGVTYSV